MSYRVLFGLFLIPVVAACTATLNFPPVTDDWSNDATARIVQKNEYFFRVGDLKLWSIDGTRIMNPPGMLKYDWHEARVSPGKHVFEFRTITDYDFGLKDSFWLIKVQVCEFECVAGQRYDWRHIMEHGDNKKTHTHKQSSDPNYP